MASLKHILGRAMNVPLNRIGWQVCRWPYPHLVTLEPALVRAAKRGADIETVIDVGASNGQWSRTVQRHFPGAFYFLIEANKVHEGGLRRFKQEIKNSDYILAAAGDTVGEVFFDTTSDPFGGAASHTPLGKSAIRVPVTTVDVQVKEKGLKAPFLVKLDTHGFEVPILNGARETLKRANLLVIETYNFTLREGCLRFHEMCAFLEPLGFRPVDLCDPLWRPTDGVLWQMDLFFAPKDSPEFESSAYA